MDKKHVSVSIYKGYCKWIGNDGRTGGDPTDNINEITKILTNIGYEEIEWIFEEDKLKQPILDLKILAIGQNVWGMGNDINEALKQMRKVGSSPAYALFIVHPGTYVTDMGDISSPLGFKPKEILRKGFKKK